MKRRHVVAIAVTAFLAVSAVAFAAITAVVPREFDPGRSSLVQAEWLSGIGCPTNQRAGQVFQPPSFSTTAPQIITDPACPTGDSSDRRVEGLLLAKTGPQANNASAVADVRNPPGTITELGWDIRKPGVDTSAGPRGSHCGAGAPRWNITTSSGALYFIGCNSPPATQTPGDGFIRMRWGAGTLAFAAAGGTAPLSSLSVRRLSIVMDESNDALGGPDNFGLTVLDNIDVNGVLVGGGGHGDDDDDDEDDDRDDD